MGPPRRPLAPRPHDHPLGMRVPVSRCSQASPCPLGGWAICLRRGRARNRARESPLPRGPSFSCPDPRVTPFEPDSDADPDQNETPLHDDRGPNPSVADRDRPWERRRPASGRKRDVRPRRIHRNSAPGGCRIDTDSDTDPGRNETPLSRSLVPATRSRTRPPACPEETYAPGLQTPAGPIGCLLLSPAAAGPPQGREEELGRALT
jgi:hypothetical protein